MARKSGSTISQEELYSSADEPAREELDDARLLDLDGEEESPFLRGQKRVSVRRGSLPKKTATRLIWAAIAFTLVIVTCFGVAALYHYGEHSWRFRVVSSDDIEISGLENVTRAQVLEVMGGDIGRNIFFVPLAQRQSQLDQIPWVESASVMRFVPNRLQIQIHERTPVAFAQVGSRILLIDAGGTLMELPAAGKKKYSFPVILGTNPGEPLSTRAARMKIYSDLISQLDSGGTHYSQDISEVDLSDPDDVKVLTNDPKGEVLVHLGSSNYFDRYKIYVGHVQQWRQQFDKLESVDLRYDRQIIVNPDLQGAEKQPPLSFSAVKAAMAAGVKPAALVTHEPLTHERLTHEPLIHERLASKPVARTVGPPVAAKKPSAKPVSKAGLGKTGLMKTSHKPASKWAKHGSSKKWAKHPVQAQTPRAVTRKTTVVAAQSENPAAKKKPSAAIAKSEGNQ
jgi:cell division protein FtsQ